MKSFLIIVFLHISISINSQPIVDLLNRLHIMALWKQEAVVLDLEVNNINYSEHVAGERKSIYVNTDISLDIQFGFDLYSGRPALINVYFKDDSNGKSFRNSYYKFAEKNFTRSPDGSYWIYSIDKSMIAVFFKENAVTIGILKS